MINFQDCHVLKKMDSNGELPIRCYGMIGSSHDKLLNYFFKNGIFANLSLINCQILVSSRILSILFKKVSL